MKNFVKTFALLAFLGLPLVACGGEGALGDECDASGDADECEEGSVCGKTSSAGEDLTCLKVCTDKAECAADEDCNGIEGTNIKGCRKQ